MDKFVIPAENAGNPTPFDVYRQEREDGTEYWSARDLMGLMGYASWQMFGNPLGRAMRTAENQEMDVTSLFTRSIKKTGGRPQEDYELSRFAAYLVAMNGDPNKPEVAAAQAYFATKTRQAETTPVRELTDEEIMARALLNANDTIKALEARAYVAEAEAEEARPKAEAFDAFIDTNGVYSMGVTAKMLGMGQNELFRLLREERVLIPDGHMRNTPYSQFRKYFEVRPRKFVNAEGREFLTHTSFVKPDGVEFIRRRLRITPPVLGLSV